MASAFRLHENTHTTFFKISTHFIPLPYEPRSLSLLPSPSPLDRFDPSRVRTNSGGPGRGAPGGNKYGGGRGDGKQAGNWNNRSGAGGRGAGVKAGTLIF